MRNRNEAEIKIKRQHILEEAKIILQEEGMDALSIRKLAKRIQQTPGIIYHYYKNKDEILLEIVNEGYQGIVMLIEEQEKQAGPADIRLYQTLSSYMKAMFEIPDIYRIMMQSKEPMILARTQILQVDISKQRSSISKLCHCIEAGVDEGIFACEHIELRAQSIWCAVYGCINRCIEESVSKEQRERVMEEVLQMILSSIRR